MSNYKALVACWNCDNKQFISIAKGSNAPDYIVKEKPPCDECGCKDTLLFFKEYQMTLNMAQRVAGHSEEEHKHNDHFA